MERMGLIPAAQYLRMSTERQQYSTENQADVIREYATRHGFEVVATYSDPGKSGVVMKRRAGLRQLIEDVVSGRCTFKAVLVYDISRWGRFQDADESAHYEFLCRASGIPIHYCAEQFSNDGTVPSSIFKALKRTMAGEYSRELGEKVITGQRRLVRLGFWVGGGAGFGMRRVMVSADGRRRTPLRDNQQKSRLSTDRTVLSPGNRAEVDCIRGIFRTLVDSRGRSGPGDIARDLNRRQIKFHDRTDWTSKRVLEILKNPKFCGCNTWGRTTQRLHTPTKKVPPELWITKANAFEAIIDPATFETAQRILKKLHTRRTAEEHLNALAKLLSKKGRLTKALIDSSQLVGGSATYCKYFGTLRHAYELVGYSSAPKDIASKVESAKVISLRASLVESIVKSFPDNVTWFKRGTRRKRPVLLLDESVEVSILVGRCFVRTGGSIAWILRQVPEERDNITLVCLMDTSNSTFERFYLFPRIELEVGLLKFDRDSSWLAGAQPLESLSAFYQHARALADCRQAASQIRSSTATANARK